MQRTSGAIGSPLDDDGLDLGPQPGDPAAFELPGGGDGIPVAIDCRDQVVDTFAGLGDRGEHRRRPVGPLGAVTDQLLEVSHDLGRSRQVRLVDHEDVGDLEDACLDDLDGVPGRRCGDHDRGVGGLHDLELGLADADRLDEASIPA